MTAPLYSGHQCSRMARTIQHRLARTRSAMEIIGPVKSHDIHQVTDGMAFTAIDPETGLEYEVRVTPHKV